MHLVVHTEENVVVDCLGTDQICPLAGNQRLVIQTFLFANDKEFVRVFHPASHLWDCLLIKSETQFVDPSGCVAALSLPGGDA
jgi:hypothetical protein